MYEGDSVNIVHESSHSTFNSKNIFKTPMQQVTLKLDENNFRSRKQQFKDIICMHNIHHLLVNPTIPPCHLIDEDHNGDT